MGQMDRRVVFTAGSFDIPHFGHINFLRQCRMIAGKEGEVVVMLSSDEFIEAYKGSKPVFSYEERKKMLEKCEYVDEVILNIGGADAKPGILMVNPNFIVIGSDWAVKDYYKQMDFTQDWLDEKGIILIYVPYTKLISTTIIKERLK